jgi:hypothetical protein
MDGKIRLLICNTCTSIEELPLYEGRPERDDTLNYRVSFHRFPDGKEHFGMLATVDAVSWENQEARSEIVKKLHEAVNPGEAAGLGTDYYNIKSTFAEDALTCWGQHNTTQDCDEWRSDKKRLYPDTRGDRKELGLSPKTRPNTWLCDFCPVTSIYAGRRNKAKGYDK